MNTQSTNGSAYLLYSLLHIGSSKYPQAIASHPLFTYTKFVENLDDHLIILMKMWFLDIQPQATATAVPTPTILPRISRWKNPHKREKERKINRRISLSICLASQRSDYNIPLFTFSVWNLKRILFRMRHLFFHISSLAYILCVCIAWHTQGKTTPSISGLTFRRCCCNFVSTFSSLQFQNWVFILSCISFSLVFLWLE